MTEHIICFSRGRRILTTVTRYASDVIEWLEAIRRIHRFRLQKLVVGLGVQWCPTFQRGVRPYPATIQLCVGRRCLIFRLCHADSIPQDLDDFLQEPQFTFVGIRIHYDAVLLRARGLQVYNYVELRHLAAERMEKRELRRASMARLASEVLDIDDVFFYKPAEVGLSNWENSTLSEKQRTYAAVDAYVSFQIGKKMEAWDCDNNAYVSFEIGKKMEAWDCDNDAYVSSSDTGGEREGWCWETNDD